MADEEAGIAQVVNINQLPGLYIPSEGCSDEHLLTLRVELSIFIIWAKKACTVYLTVYLIICLTIYLTVYLSI